MKTIYLLNLFYIITTAKKGFGPGIQDHGYVKVRPCAHMFWWLYETTANLTLKTDKPLLIWLQGGPGSTSSGYGNFEEIGPLDVNLKLRKYSWIQDVNLLFIDSPVGTGFSYVDNPNALAKTNKEIATDLITCLEGFYKEHPEYKSVPLYLAGESYGGKVAVEFAFEWDNKFKADGAKSNLEGIALIDSWISPIDSVSTWGNYLYNLGTIDKQGLDVINKSSQRIKTALENKQFALATHQWAYLQALIHNITYKEVDKIHDTALHDLMNGPVKKALGLNRTWVQHNSDVFNAQRKEFMRPVTNIVEQLLNYTNIKVFVINGQLDLIVNTPGTLAWVDRLQWKLSRYWKRAPRLPLAVHSFLEGFKRVVKQLAFYWVNRSGHMVPKDNPIAMRAILNDLIRNPL